MSETADFAFILRCGSFPLLTYLSALLLNFAAPRFAHPIPESRRRGPVEFFNTLLKPNFLFR